MKRSPLLDIYRFLAMALMVFFHLSFDLSLFGQLEIDFKEDPFWFGLPRLIVFMFYTASGLSLALVHQKKIDWEKIKKRSWQLGLGALAITLSTYIMYPKNYVYFGTLHCLWLCTFLALPLIPYPKLALGLGLIFLLSNFIFRPEFFPLGKFLGGIESIDYIPLYPWVGAVWLGIGIAPWGLHLRPFPGKLPIKAQTTIEWCSRHSLMIYLLHQPVLFSLCYLIFWLLPSWTK